MRKLSEYKDDEAIELLADILDPVCSICADKEVVESMSKSKIEFMRTCMKSHPADIRRIMSVLEGVPYEEYHMGVFDIPIKLVEILNDVDLMSFFQSQGQMVLNDNSGSATENTMGAGEPTDS